MGKLLTLFILALALIIGLSAAPAIRAGLDDRNEHQQLLYRLDEQRRQLDLERYQQTQPARVAQDYAFGLLLVVGAALVLIIGYDMYRRRATPIVRVSDRLIMPRVAIERGDQYLIDIMADAIRAAGIAEIEGAPRYPPACLQPAHHARAVRAYTGSPTR
jgi:hypothetical protein